MKRNFGQQRDKKKSNAREIMLRGKTKTLLEREKKIEREGER